jgi:hypothetical protein
MNDIKSFAPRNSGDFPWSRDFETHISCDNEGCICHGWNGCAVPSNCQIDNTGRCKWYSKQLEQEKLKGESK